MPLHHMADEIKLKKLDKITARCTFGVSVFLGIIRSTGIATKSGLAEFEKDVQKSTKLSSGFVQQCRDKAVWMWKSYLKLHKKWERRAARCKDEKYLKKLMKREPSEPAVNGKCPVRLDSRTASLVSNLALQGPLSKKLRKELRLSGSWLSVSTLARGKRMMLPLSLAWYHLRSLEEADRIIDCEIVNKNGKYFVHFTCEYSAPEIEIKHFKVVDLGILRSMSAVLLDCAGNLVRNSFEVTRDNELQSELRRIDEEINHLQAKSNWKLLKKIREYRKNFFECHLRKASKKFASGCESCKVIVGYPKHIKYRHFRGNGNKRHRKRLARWSYGQQISYLRQACEKKGINVMPVNEAYSSKECCNCSSRNTVRPYNDTFSLMHCNDCSHTYNADFNACVKLGMRFVAPQCSATEGCVSKQRDIKMTAPLNPDDHAQKHVSG